MYDEGGVGLLDEAAECGILCVCVILTLLLLSKDFQESEMLGALQLSG